jgi:hypothetical protein
VSPSSSTTGQPVTFVGHGADPLHAIEEWRWRSSSDGILSTAPSFSTSALTVGIHNIFFMARCSGPKWSAEVFTPFVVGAQNTKPLPVYRFYNSRAGVHFFTASEVERADVQAKLSSTYTLEGVGYALDTSATANDTPLYRFYKPGDGVHFYTADVAERDDIRARLGASYRYEGEAYKVSLTSTGTQPVYRFYNLKRGTHFFTVDPNEVNDIITRLGATYRFEGIAYYYAPPW